MSGSLPVPGRRPPARDAAPPMGVGPGRARDEFASTEAATGDPVLRDYAARLRALTGRAVPDFDPADGGARARMLLLLETPGPAIFGTGVVSRDNPTGTARNLRRFLDAAGIARRDLAIWNAVPFVIHESGARNRAPRAGEVAEGLRLLPSLLRLLPRLEVAVLAGRVAAAAEPVLREARPGLAVLTMPHPSPTFVCTSPEVPARIAATLGLASAILSRKHAA